jgi:hypothetical protein
MVSTIVKRIVDDPVLGYKISDMDGAGDPSYYGYVKNDGSWYIMRINESDGSVRYARGVSKYTDNWSNRVTGVSYNYFDVIF